MSPVFSFESVVVARNFHAPTATDGIDGVQQIARDGPLENEGVGAGFHYCPANALLVVDTEDDHLELGAARPECLQPAQTAASGQRQIDDRHVGSQSSRRIEQ